ncbi:MAG TPA: nucleotide exchange factor GrpE [Clostridia bacterium]|nr:nucleotide exchange factor GrpE [Clostridia bacterium]
MAKKKDPNNGPEQKGKKSCNDNSDTPINDTTAAGPEQKAGKDNDKAGEKKVSENDVLKLYLEQAISELKKTKSQLEESKKLEEQAKDEVKTYQEKLKSLAAEYENYRRRTSAEKESINADAIAKAVTALLPALDSLEKAAEFTQSNPESIRQGLEMTLKQLSEGFANLGVSEIDAKGAGFNPDLHNAVMHVEDETLGESVVTDVFQKGYQIGEKVIRHSVVKVAN